MAQQAELKRQLDAVRAFIAQVFQRTKQVCSKPHRLSVSNPRSSGIMIQVNDSNTPDESPVLAVGHREAARLIGLSERKLHTMVKNREILPSRLGGRRLYIVEDLKRLLEERRG
jgi:hypothetical protein